MSSGEDDGNSSGYIRKKYAKVVELGKEDVFGDIDPIDAQSVQQFNLLSPQNSKEEEPEMQKLNAFVQKVSPQLGEMVHPGNLSFIALDQNRHPPIQEESAYEQAEINHNQVCMQYPKPLLNVQNRVGNIWQGWHDQQEQNENSFLHQPPNIQKKLKNGVEMGELMSEVKGLRKDLGEIKQQLAEVRSGLLILEQEQQERGLRLSGNLQGVIKSKFNEFSNNLGRQMREIKNTQLTFQQNIRQLSKVINQMNAKFTEAESKNKILIQQKYQSQRQIKKLKEEQLAKDNMIQELLAQLGRKKIILE